jgi:hypothetical protein
MKYWINTKKKKIIISFISSPGPGPGELLPSLGVWRPSWISDQHKKQYLGKGHSNDHSFTVWVRSVH